MGKQVKYSIYGMVLLLVTFICVQGCAQQNVNKVVRVSTTTSVNDSGLLPYLQAEFEKDTEYKLEITSAGTGAAIEKARMGDADCILVHAKDAEETFIEEGYGLERIVLMYNYFTIAGPSSDPCNVRGAMTASEAFSRIAQQEGIFVSRGDDSGTHKKEVAIWENAGVPYESEVWYINTGQGMGGAYNIAVEQQAYIFMDKGTYLSHDKKNALEILLEESPDLKNVYSVIAVNPEKWTDTNLAGVNTLVDWLQSEKAKEMIRGYGVEEYGQPLFFLD